MKLRELIDRQGRKSFKISSDKTVEEAVKFMIEKDVSALIVEEHERPAGIFTEKDMITAYKKFGRERFLDTPLREAMTNKLIVASPDDSLEQSISLMLQTGIKHLPVVEQGEVTTILYICDLIHEQVGALTADVHYLEEYLQDLERAKKD